MVKSGQVESSQSRVRCYNCSFLIPDPSIQLVVVAAATAVAAAAAAVSRVLSDRAGDKLEMRKESDTLLSRVHLAILFII